MTTFGTFLGHMEDAQAVGIPREKQSYQSVFPNDTKWQFLKSSSPAKKQLCPLDQVVASLDIREGTQQYGLKEDTSYGICPFTYKGNVLEIWQRFSTASWPSQLDSLARPKGSQDSKTSSSPRSLRVKDDTYRQSLTILCDFVDDGDKLKEGDEDFVDGDEKYVNPADIDLTATDAELGTFHYAYQPNEHLFIEFANVPRDRGFQLESTAEGTTLHVLTPPQTEETLDPCSEAAAKTA